MNIVFLGNSHFSFLVLRKLLVRNISIQKVVTGTDKPSRRGNEPVANSVAMFAKLNKISLIKTDEPESITKKLKDVDIILTASYGKILPKKVLDVPKYAVNIHTSLLPLYRGAAPIQRAILNGDEKTGVSLMLMDEGLDDGDIIAQKKTPIEKKTYVQLEKELALMGVELFIDFLKNHQTITPIKQNHKLATYAHKINKEDGFLNFAEETNVQIMNKIRALAHNPGTYFFHKNLKIKILSAKPYDDFHDKHAPCSVSIIDDCLFIRCKTGYISILEITVPGKKPLEIVDFMRGNNILNDGDIVNKK